MRRSEIPTTWSNRVFPKSVSRLVLALLLVLLAGAGLTLYIGGLFHGKGSPLKALVGALLLALAYLLPFWSGWAD